jgi:ferredoxin-NADP reductase
VIEPALAGDRAPSGGRRRATIREITHPTPHGVRLRLDVPDRMDHLPGQHYVIRLTAPDGYVAQRSYSVASAPDDPLIELFVERLDDGEVSTYLADVAQPGDELEVRGPIGGWFVWRADAAAVGIGGGSGVVPLIAMLRHADRLGRRGLLRLAVSSRTRVELPYADELTEHGAVIALTREDVPGGRPRGRLATADLRPLLEDVDPGCFICGSAGFAEAASDLLLGAGVAADRIRVERFGPTG